LNAKITLIAKIAFPPYRSRRERDRLVSALLGGGWIEGRSAVTVFRAAVLVMLTKAATGPGDRAPLFG
jgi:hypothetical protein